MATGDATDIVARVKQLIPFRWFKWTAPMRDAVLGGLADSAAWCYQWIVFDRRQSRIATSTGIFLDIISYDFLRRHLPRGQMDDNTFRARILATILQERVTRKGMVSALTNFVGTTPNIFEPWNTGDAGAWSGRTVAQASHGLFAWANASGAGGAGGWGSTDLPAQCFINLTRSKFSGVPNVAGWSSTGHLSGLGGWGVGSIELIGASISQVGVTDPMIYDTINTTRPTGSICWTRFN
jgi:hypothetical protein